MSVEVRLPPAGYCNKRLVFVMHPAGILNGLVGTEHAFPWFFSARPNQRLSSIFTTNHSRLFQSHYLLGTFFAYPDTMWPLQKDERKHLNCRLNTQNSSSQFWPRLETLAEMMLFIYCFNSTKISPLHTCTVYNSECEKGRSCFPFKAANQTHENIEGFGVVTTAMRLHLLGYKAVKPAENPPMFRRNT
jgi:hypothetical protein